ncbi:MAG: hypothetical protein U0821_04470 [Chloroflexota bacterium]
MLLVLLLLAGSGRVGFAQSATGDWFAIPNGRFFVTAAQPAEAGYMLANAAGVPMLDEWQRLGGLDPVGVPTSQRFIAGGLVAQRFEKQGLVWLPQEGRAEPRPLTDLGAVPPFAAAPMPSPRSSGAADRVPWSGWWWPANDRAGGPRLFDPDGPLAHYDRLVEAMGRPDPGTTEWERAELYFEDFQWAGHCNGWAAAAILEPEPTVPREISGIRFGVAEQKGLLTSYHFADAALWTAGGTDEPLTPGELHQTLLSWIGQQHRALIVTFQLEGDEVWSYPAYRYETVFGPHESEPGVWRVRTTLWLVDNDVPTTFTGAKPWPSAEGKTFEYTVSGDPRRPSGGEWGPRSKERFGTPTMLWYPDPARRNVDRQLSSPALDYGLISRITRGETGAPAFLPGVSSPVPVASPTPRSDRRRR